MVRIQNTSLIRKGLERPLFGTVWDCLAVEGENNVIIDLLILHRAPRILSCADAILRLDEWLQKMSVMDLIECNGNSYSSFHPSTNLTYFCIRHAGLSLQHLATWDLFRYNSRIVRHYCP
jgi:hypothetical protein